MTTYHPLNAPMQTGGIDPYQNLRFAGQVDWRHVNPQLLNALQAVAHARGITVDVISGYRDSAYSAAHGGFAGDPHTEGIAVDAYVGGKPIGDVIPPQDWARYGVRSGDSFTYKGKTDPEHLDLLAGGNTSSHAPAAAGSGGGTHDVGTFLADLIHSLGGKATPATVRALETWQRMEGGSTNNPDTYNFLNTTQHVPGSHGTGNVDGVQAYQSFEQGLAATLQTLHNGRYQPIIRAIQTGDWSPTPALAHALQTWSGGGYSSILGSANGGAYTPLPEPGVPGGSTVQPGATVPAQGLTEAHNAAQNAAALKLLSGLLSSTAKVPVVNPGFAPLTLPAPAVTPAALPTLNLAFQGNYGRPLG